MSFPVPRPGLVIRYSYLWKRESDLGREEGVKDRPCAVILVVFDQQARQRVRVLPITRQPPRDPAEAFELSPLIKRHLGLDDSRSWIMLTEANDFLWPGPDLRFLPGRGPESAVYGFLPPNFFKALRKRLVECYRTRRLSITQRTD